MKKILLLCMSLLLLNSLVSAVDFDSGINITIVNGTLTVKDYITPFGTVITGTNAVFDSFTQNVGTLIVCQNPFVDVNGTNGTYYKQSDCHIDINFYKELPLKKNFINSTSNCTTTDYYVVNSATQKELDNCKTDKAIIQGNLQALANENGSISKATESYAKCMNDLGKTENLQTQITALEKEKEDTKNTKWIYGVVGLAGGIVGMMFYTGKWGKQKIKNPEDSYNRSQSA